MRIVPGAAASPSRAAGGACAVAGSSMAAACEGRDQRCGEGDLSAVAGSGVSLGAAPRTELPDPPLGVSLTASGLGLLASSLACFVIVAGWVKRERSNICLLGLAAVAEENRKRRTS